MCVDHWSPQAHNPNDLRPPQDRQAGRQTGVPTCRPITVQDNLLPPAAAELELLQTEARLHGPVDLQSLILGETLLTRRERRHQRAAVHCGGFR